MTPTRLYTGRPPILAGLLAYSAPAGGMVITNIFAANNSAGAKSVSVSVILDGVTAYLLPAKVIAANDYHSARLFLPMAAGDEIYVLQADAALPVYLNISGITPP